MPTVSFLPRSESLAGQDSEYSGFYYYLACPNCNHQVIEIYLDKILTPTDCKVISLDSDEHKGSFFIMRMEQILLHELGHWAGCDDEEAIELEDFAGSHRRCEECVRVDGFAREA
jgi:hypothetical protein